MVIAEIGVNHDGSVETAKRLIEAAKKSGADAAKFQLFESHVLDPPGTRRDMLRALELSQSQMRVLVDECSNTGIEFMCSAFDVQSLKFLAYGIKANYIKIGSGNLKNDDLLKEAAICERPVIISTGMATMPEILSAKEIIDAYAWLHCTSSYPAPMDEINLLAIATMKKNCMNVGFSDHTSSTVLAAAAVAIGAVIVEKHFTLDRNQDGPDHKSSIDPLSFKSMVKNIRRVELALGDGIKRPMPSEEAVMQVRDEREAHRCAS